MYFRGIDHLNLNREKIRKERRKNSILFQNAKRIHLFDFPLIVYIGVHPNSLGILVDL